MCVRDAHINIASPRWRAMTFDLGVVLMQDFHGGRFCFLSLILACSSWQERGAPGQMSLGLWCTVLQVISPLGPQLIRRIGANSTLLNRYICTGVALAADGGK